MRKIVVAAAVAATAAMFGYAYSSQPSPSAIAALAKSSGGLTGGPAAAIAKRAASGIWGPGSAGKGGIPYTLIQTTPTTVQVPDATSAATAVAGGEATGAAETSPEVVSGASEEESAVKDAAYCLKCHGPFEKLAARTKDYVTEWDEAANPHVYVPHDSKSIVECSECHDPHAIPFKPSESARKPNVDYCYSCHHAQTLVNCNQCHNE